jgi:hypothetical protein
MTARHRSAFIPAGQVKDELAYPQVKLRFDLVPLLLRYASLIRPAP